MSSDYPKILLQLLHSALIDVLSERFPKESLVLGLPARQQGWSLPSDGNVTAAEARVSMVSSGARSVYACVAGDGLPPEVWKAVRGKVEGEMKLRGIVGEFRNELTRAEAEKVAKMTVWLPIHVGTHVFFAGVSL